MITDSKVLFCKTPSGVGHIQLNAQKKLNALDTEMLQAIQIQLLKWAQDTEVLFVLFSSTSSRAFCAGGDVKSLVLDFLKDGVEAAHRFFTTEYSTDYLIHVYDKPIVALTNGVVMGGGLGLIAGADIKVTTEAAIIAMPEVSIGLFPDVGAGHFLNQLPNGMGRGLGLTGFRLSGVQAVELGLFQHCVSDSELQNLQNELLTKAWKAADLMDELTQVVSGYGAIGVQNTLNHETQEFLQQWSPDPEVCEKKILEFSTSDQRIQEAQEFFAEGSPLSRRLIHQQFLRSASLALRDDFLMEWSLAMNCCLQGDFVEGVKAKLIDKTGQPSWKKRPWSESDLSKFFDPPAGENGLALRFLEMGL